MIDNNAHIAVSVHLRDGGSVHGYVRKEDEDAGSNRWVGMYFGTQQVTLFPVKGQHGKDQLANLLIQLGCALLLDQEIEWEAK